MEDERIEIDSNLLAWIKDKAKESKDSQIILTIKDGRIIRASCYMSSAFGEDRG